MTEASGRMVAEISRRAGLGNQSAAFWRQPRLCLGALLLLLGDSWAETIPSFRGQMPMNPALLAQETSITPPEAIAAPPAEVEAAAPAAQGEAGSVEAPPAGATTLAPSNPGEVVPEIPSQLMPPGIDQMVPFQPPPVVDAAPAAGPQEEEEVVAPPPTDPKTLKYPVSQFLFKYGAGAKLLPHLPPLGQMTRFEVELGLIKEGVTAPERGQKKERIDPNVKKKRTYFGDAILAINKGLVTRLNERGIYGVYVLPEAAEVDPATGEDKRTDKGPLTLVVYVSEVKEVRSVTRRVPGKPDDKPIINDPTYKRLREKSPIAPASDKDPGSSLLRRQVLQDYIARVNRFPGRRVDGAVNASDEPGKISLDYLVREQKLWSGYLQTSNTGTESTGEWRTRAGAEVRQLLKLDDILRVDYSTSDFSRFQAASVSYEFAPLFPDYLKSRTYFSWGQYSSQDLGSNLPTFEGRTFTTGTSLTWTPLYVMGFPLDITGGIEWQNVLSTSSDDFFGSGGGSTNFLLPYIGLGTERGSDRFTLAANVEVQSNLAGLIGTDQGAALAQLGRPDVNREFYLLKFNLVASAFVEPFLFGRAYDEQKIWWKSARAHEFAFSAHGQTTLGDSRLVPQLQSVVGGFNTVRGYPESFVVGDSAYNGTLEYRLHIPRLFRPTDQAPPPKPKASRAAKGKAGQQGTSDPSSADPLPPPAAKKFVLWPEHIGSSPDWDLIFRGFLDAGQTTNNRVISNSERDRTLVGVGVGLELQILKPVFVSLRADYGIALTSQTEDLSRSVEAGDSRIHISATIAF